MSLVNTIKSITTTLYPDYTFIFASKFKASRQSFDINKCNMPLIVLDNELTKDVEIKKNFTLNKSTRLLLYVLDKEDKFATDEAVNDSIEASELICDRILNALIQNDNVELSANQKYKLTPIFNAYVAGLSGVVLDVNVIEKQVINICTI